VCEAGKGPDAAHDSCAQCTGNQKSEYGACEPCPEGTTANAKHTYCLTPFNCGQGNFCTLVDGCTDNSHCHKCEVGKFTGTADATKCDDCRVTGKATNKEQTACINCQRGQEPSPDHSHCVSCSGGTNFSVSGAKCVACQFPRYVKIDEGGQRVDCLGCPTGQGPNGEWSPDGPSDAQVLRIAVLSGFWMVNAHCTYICTPYPVR
jgi:hypothetical protein